MGARMRPFIVLALLLPAGAVSGSAPEETTLQCGELSPFDNACTDCCGRLGSAVELTVGLLGFVGDLKVELKGDDGSWVWRCWSLGVSEVPGTAATPTLRLLSGCDAPQGEEDPPRRGERVSLACTASDTKGPGLPLPKEVGPWGPWGCKVTL